MKAMYTSWGFGGQNSGSCNHNFKNQEFLDIQRKKIPEYCGRHNIPLHVIGYDNNRMKQIFNHFDRDIPADSKKHAIYTLSALAAIFDFCDSPYEEFYWMHLDMVINKPEINIFDTFELDDDTIYNWEFVDMHTYGYDSWQDTKFRMRRMLFAWFNVPFDPRDEKLHLFSNCSTIMMKKNAAIKFRDAILEYFDFFTYLVHDIYPIEETFMECINYLCDDLTFTHIRDVKTIGEYEGQPFPITFKPMWGDPDPCDHKDSVFIHYWGEHKKTIAQFYRDRGEL